MSHLNVKSPDSQRNAWSIDCTPVQTRQRTSSRCARHGVVSTFMALMLPVVLAVAAYAINVVYMELARTELQITIDVATRAAGRVFAVTGDRGKAIAAAERYMAENSFANQKMTVSGADIVFGVSTRYSESDRYSFDNGANPNAVNIEANGQMKVPMLFPTLGVPVEFRPVKSSICTQTAIDIAIVIDRSGSMAYNASEAARIQSPPAAAPPGWTFGAPVPPESRWLDAVNSCCQFLKIIENSGHQELVSLCTYSTFPTLDVALTDDYSQIENALLAYTNHFVGGSTNIGDGIVAGTQLLANKTTARPWATRVLVVLTDGNHNLGTDPLSAAVAAASQDIMIYAVSFSAEANVATMDAIANIGHGKHYHVESGAELATAFKDIAKCLPTLISN